VDVERILIEAVPETDFLGKWQAITGGEVQVIDIQPTGVCVFTMSSGSKPIRGGMSVPGRWFLTPKEIYIEIKDKGKYYCIYRGYLDKEGKLVVDKGEIHPQGHFVLAELRPTVFKKVY
jgi:hypothetical protein